MLAVHIPAKRAYGPGSASGKSLRPPAWHRRTVRHRPAGSFVRGVRGFDPGDIEGGPECRPELVDALAHPSHPGVSPPAPLFDECSAPRLHPELAMAGSHGGGHSELPGCAPTRGLMSRTRTSNRTVISCRSAAAARNSTNNACSVSHEWRHLRQRAIITFITMLMC